MNLACDVQQHMVHCCLTGGRLHATDKFSCILPLIKAQVYISRAASQALRGGLLNAPTTQDG